MAVYGGVSSWRAVVGVLTEPRFLGCGEEGNHGCAGICAFPDIPADRFVGHFRVVPLVPNQIGIDVPSVFPWRSRDPAIRGGGGVDRRRTLAFHHSHSIAAVASFGQSVLGQNQVVFSAIIVPDRDGVFRSVHCGE